MPLLDVDQMAERLGTSPRFIRRIVAEHRIAYAKLGRHVRIDAADLDAFVAAGRVEAGGRGGTAERGRPDHASDSSSAPRRRTAVAPVTGSGRSSRRASRCEDGCAPELTSVRQQVHDHDHHRPLGGRAPTPRSCLMARPCSGCQAEASLRRVIAARSRATNVPQGGAIQGASRPRTGLTVKTPDRVKDPCHTRKAACLTRITSPVRERNLIRELSTGAGQPA